jgi:hypothetical protein
MHDQPDFETSSDSNTFLATIRESFSTGPFCVGFLAECAPTRSAVPRPMRIPDEADHDSWVIAITIPV